MKIRSIAETIVVSSFFVIWLITIPDNSLYANIYTIACLLIWFGIFFLISRKWVPQYLLPRKIKTYLLYSALLLLITIMVLVFVRLMHLEEMYYRRYYIMATKLDYLLHFKWRYFDHLLISVFAVWIGSTLYGLLTAVGQTSRKLPIRMLPKVIISVAAGLSLYLVVYVFDENRPLPQTVYTPKDDNKNIVFVEEETGLAHLSDVLDKVELTDEPLVILFWAQSCYFQGEAVKKMDAIRSQLSDKGIDYLYICAEYLERSDWQRFIETKKIEGTHIYLKRKDFHQLLIDELGVKSGLAHVMVLDKDHTSKLLDGAFPDNAESLTTLLSY